MANSASRFPGKDFNLRLESAVSGLTIFWSAWIDRAGTQSQTYSNMGTSAWEVTGAGSSRAKQTGLNFDFRGSASSFQLSEGSFTVGSAGTYPIAAFANYDELGYTENSHLVTVVTVPAAPTPNSGTPSAITSSSMRYQFTSGSNGGSAVLESQVQRANDAGFTSGVQTVSNASGTTDFTGLAAVTQYHFRSRQRNAVGWGPWSATRSGTTLANIPGVPGGPWIANIQPTQMTVSWTIPANGGAAIDQIKLRRSSTPDFASYVDYDLPANTTSHTPTGLSPNSPYYWKVYARNSVGYGVGTDAAGAYTAPAAPSAPNAVVVSRNSDNSHTIQWNRTASAGAPYASQQVQRLDTVTNIWTGVANFGGENTAGASSWTDTGTIANRAYRYRIKVSNTTGEATSGTSLWVFTTPGTPSSLSAVKQASGDIVITVVQTVTYPNYKTELHYRVGAGAWTSLPNLATGVTTYTWTPPAGSSVQFRARVVVDAGEQVGDGLLSAYVESNVVPLLSAPNPPSALSPNGVAFDAVNAQAVSWQHNTVDSSAQSAYEFQYRIGSGPWTSTGKALSTVSGTVIPAGALSNGNVYQWQVRTWGAYTDPSAWSAVAVFTASASPSVAITAPGAVLEAALVTVSWIYNDPEGTAQSLWAADLLFQGAVIEQHSGSGATTSVPFATRLTDATDYQVRVRARDGSSLWSEWDQASFTTDFPLPPAPVLDALWEKSTGAVTLTVTNPAHVPEVEFNQILRSLDDGATWEHVLTITPNSSGFDTGVPLGVAAVQYKAISWTGLPSSSESSVQFVDTTADRGYWSAGRAFEKVVQLRVNMGTPPKIDLTTGIAQKTLHYFAGRTAPVEMSGEATQRIGSVEFAVTSVAELGQVRSMALLVAPHLFRLPDGTLIYGSVGPVSDTRLADGWYHITFQVTEVDR